MKKSITTKKAMMMIANNINRKLGEKLGIYTGHDFKRLRRETGSTIELTIYAGNECEITSPCLESILEVVKPYEEKYDGRVFYCLGAYPYKYTKDMGWFYTPCVFVHVSCKDMTI